MPYAGNCFCPPYADRLAHDEIQLLTERCTKCDQCAAKCPLNQGGKDGFSIREVLQDGCIACGMCMSGCHAEAIGYDDDLERFLADLRQGKMISLLAAPAVIKEFPDYRRVFGYLQALGVRAFYNVLLRADITLWAYTEILRRYQGTLFFSSPCAAIMEYIGRHRPDLLSQVMPVYSPLLCTIIYLQKYRQIKGQLAFLSPCVAKRRELRAYGGGGYNITIRKLQEYMKDQRIRADDYPPVDFCDAAEGSGVTLAAYGGISECLAALLPELYYDRRSGPDRVYSWLAAKNNNKPIRQGGLVELYNCLAGCEGGTGICQASKQKLPPISSYPIARPENMSERYEAVLDQFSTFSRKLILSDFVMTSSYRHQLGYQQEGDAVLSAEGKGS